MNKQDCRDLIYVSRPHADGRFCYAYGIEFAEFLPEVKPPLANLLLLNHRFGDAKWNAQTGLEYVTAREIGLLIEDDVYGYGDFCWVDMEREEDLNRLTRPQIAELLLFGHLAETLGGLPLARFAYYAHDDGWFNKTYFAAAEDYAGMLSGVVRSKLSLFAEQELNDLPKTVQTGIMAYASDGLFIDFLRIEIEDSRLRVPVATVGHHLDMDLVYGLREGSTDVQAWLVYMDGKWKLAKGHE